MVIPRDDGTRKPTSAPVVEFLREIELTPFLPPAVITTRVTSLARMDFALAGRRLPVIIEYGVTLTDSGDSFIWMSLNENRITNVNIMHIDAMHVIKKASWWCRTL